MKSVRFLLPLSLLALAASAHAGLLGSTVHVEYFFPNTGSLYEDEGNAVVGAGVEYNSILGGILSLDLDDSSLAYTANSSTSFTNGSFNGLKITSLSGLAFTSATYVGGGLAPFDISISGGALFLNYQGVGFSAGDVSNIRFTTAAAVPGPAAIAPFLLGGIATLRRRKRA